MFLVYVHHDEVHFVIESLESLIRELSRFNRSKVFPLLAIEYIRRPNNNGHSNVQEYENIREARRVPQNNPRQRNDAAQIIIVVYRLT